MKRIGVTGGIGAGKTTGARYITDLGFPVIDTDDVARAIVEPGTEGLAAVVDAFGTGILTAQGRLDRNRLAAIVFPDSEARARLEALLHPRIQRVWSSFLDHEETKGVPAAFVVIPLLFEKGYQSRFDAVIAVGCSESTQRHRLEQRGWAPDDIRSRVSSQWTTASKMAAAGYVVWNEGTLAVQRTQWALLLDHLLPGFVAGMAARSAGS